MALNRFSEHNLFPKIKVQTSSSLLSSITRLKTSVFDTIINICIVMQDGRDNISSISILIDFSYYVLSGRIARQWFHHLATLAHFFQQLVQQLHRLLRTQQLRTEVLETLFDETLTVWTGGPALVVTVWLFQP